jgi:hypothetical protein
VERVRLVSGLVRGLGVILKGHGFISFLVARTRKGNFRLFHQQIPHVDNVRLAFRGSIRVRFAIVSDVIGPVGRRMKPERAFRVGDLCRIKRASFRAFHRGSKIKEGLKFIGIV